MLTFLFLPYVSIGQTSNPNRGAASFLSEPDQHGRHSSAQPRIIVEFHQTHTVRAEVRGNIGPGWGLKI